MAGDGAHRVETGARHGQKLVANPQEVLADDMQVRIRHQMVDIGDPSGDRVLHRDHGIRDLAGGHRGERFFEGRQATGSQSG
jgi:hypothetical protein